MAAQAPLQLANNLKAIFDVVCHISGKPVSQLFSKQKERPYLCGFETAVKQGWLLVES